MFDDDLVTLGDGILKHPSSELVPIHRAKDTLQSQGHIVRNVFCGGVAGQREEDPHHLLGSGIVITQAERG